LGEGSRRGCFKKRKEKEERKVALHENFSAARSLLRGMIKTYLN
jgi:hypothetical protein